MAAPLSLMLKNYDDAQKLVTSLYDTLIAETQSPLNKSDDGRLTKRGEAVLYKLFGGGLRDSRICELMDISSPAVCNRRKAWRLMIDAKQVSQNHPTAVAA